MVDPQKKSHIYCNLLQFSHYLRFGIRILIFFGAQSFIIPIFRFIEYLEHTYWYQNGAPKRVRGCGCVREIFASSSSQTILCKIIDLSNFNADSNFEANDFQEMV